MEFVWMFLSLVIGISVAYLIWDEYIVKRERRGESNAERYAEADIKALADEAQPAGHMSNAEAAAALHTAAADAEAATAEAEAPTESASAPETVAEIVAEDAGAALDEAVAEVEDEAELVATRAAAVTDVLDIAPDNLTKVKGIGKVYQERLNEAGIYTFAQLAEADPAKLAEIAKAIDAANVEDWPRQARELLG